MLRVGLTGGIGSGKTTVARMFETLGIPLYYADDAAKRLLNTDPALKSAVQQLFGEACYTNGVLNRSYLASIVFNDSEKLAALNQLVHPATIADSNAWFLHQETDYAIREAALLFESGAAEGLDYVIGVSAPAPLRIQRVMLRDGSNEEDVKKRMATQLQDTIKLKLCDWVVINDEREALLPQVLSLHEQLTLRATQSRLQ